ncbi:site-specific integrase [Mucilaginibacter sp. SMC90]|uniref:site-specific integrase n=1 Tax=Mucilaginibacter sp. SMC90 TaxID=2929803 RepID=UPI001FB2F148|nr:site-specific integrase [Mucilaginibacter sp. SMC90]UOE51006.1 site-specific integrase [Mucilaginibacter sp. SMC90]
MATICAMVLKHHLKNDGTYNVKIRITHKKEKRYIDTEHFVTSKQLSKSFAVKDAFINRVVNLKIDEYRLAISSISEKLDFFDADGIRDFLLTNKKEIDFIEFCDSHILQLKESNRKGTAGNHTTVRNSLVDYFGREKVMVTEITASMLKSFEKFLRSARIISRANQLRRVVVTKCDGVTDAGLYNYMRDLRTLFNAAREKYNDEDLGIIRITHYPFTKYKVGTPPDTRKRNISMMLLVKILECKVPKNSRAELAKELFLLSFYLCGINAVDLYHITKANVKKGRLEYNRSKTKGKRKDNAFISIKIINDAAPLLEKYIEKLRNRYSSSKGFDGALSKGMKKLREITGIPEITYYWARHSFANCARNDCRISKDDIALALNHVDNGHRTTDIYIAKDWKIVDEVQLNVMKLLNRNLSKSKKVVLNGG